MSLVLALAILADFCPWSSTEVIVLKIEQTDGFKTYIYINIYKGLRILSRYYSCQDSEFRSAMETSSVDIDL